MSFEKIQIDDGRNIGLHDGDVEMNYPIKDSQKDGAISQLIV